jgi:hypothetical protein
MLDPQDCTEKVGEYSLFFFGEEDGVSRPIKKFIIGPNMSLERQHVEAEDDGPAVIFNFRPGAPGVSQAYQIAFDEASTASAFARDFRIRSQFMDLALTTVGRQKERNQARSELAELRRNSLSARLFRYTCYLIVTLLVGFALCLAVRCANDRAKAPAVHLQIVVQDLSSVVKLLQKAALSAASKVCELGTGAVPAATLQKCLEVGGVSQVRECVAALLP